MEVTKIPVHLGKSQRGHRHLVGRAQLLFVFWEGACITASVDAVSASGAGGSSVRAGSAAIFVRRSLWDAALEPLGSLAPVGPSAPRAPRSPHLATRPRNPSTPRPPQPRSLPSLPRLRRPTSLPWPRQPSVPCRPRRLR
jgi:hypothetical protein